MTSTPVTIRFDPHQQLVEAVLDEGPEKGEVAGVSQYRVERDGVNTFVHTEVDDRFEGQGIGSQLAAGVIDTARQRGFTIVPQCSFLRRHMADNEETHDVLAEGASLSEV